MVLATLSGATMTEEEFTAHVKACQQDMVKAKSYEERTMIIRDTLERRNVPIFWRNPISLVARARIAQFV